MKRVGQKFAGARIKGRGFGITGVKEAGIDIEEEEEEEDDEEETEAREEEEEEEEEEETEAEEELTAVPELRAETLRFACARVVTSAGKTLLEKINLRAGTPLTNDKLPRAVESMASVSAA